MTLSKICLHSKRAVKILKRHDWIYLWINIILFGFGLSSPLVIKVFNFCSKHFLLSASFSNPSNVSPGQIAIILTLLPFAFELDWHLKTNNISILILTKNIPNNSITPNTTFICIVQYKYIYSRLFNIILRFMTTMNFPLFSVVFVYLCLRKLPVGKMEK